MATEIRDRKRATGSKRLRNGHRRKKEAKKYFKKDFAVSEKVPTFAVPTEGNSDGRDARSQQKRHVRSTSG